MRIKITLLAFLFCGKLLANDNLISTCLILEAGGEKDPRAMSAILEVINNRSKISKKSWDEVVLKKYQFSCFNGKTAENIKDLIKNTQKHPKFNKALEIVRNNKVTNYTLGATHYHNLTVRPYWAKDKYKTVKIQNHIFYKLN